MLKEKHILSSAVYHDIMKHLIKMLSQLHCYCVEENTAETLEQQALIDFESMWASMKKVFVNKKLCDDIGFVEPEQVFVSESHDDFYHYIPILKSLQVYISRKDVFASIIAARANVHDHSLLTDYVDSEYFKKNSYFKGECSFLRLHFYCDEVEVCNPIGSSKGLQKLVCIYFLLGNVETKYWSMLRNVHVIAVANSSLVIKHGYNVVFQKLQEDLLTLERDGVIVEAPDKTVQVFHGGLTTISGDNLSNHEIGGFRRCFSSGLISRVCMCCYEDLQAKMHETCFTLRTSQSHKYHVRSVITDASLMPVYGVHCDSPFSALWSFDVIESLPPDIMHDILEGILPILLSTILEHLNSSKILSKRQFSELLNKFQFCKNDNRNKPTSRKKGIFRKLTASQSHCFIFFRLLSDLTYQIILQYGICICYFRKLCKLSLLLLFHFNR